MKRRSATGWACVGWALLVLRSAAGPVLPAVRLQTNDVVALVGAGAWVAEQRDGYLEAALRRTHPGHALRIRNFAWDGDTVSTRPREVNYPDVPSLLRRFGATIAFVQFGQGESFAGDAGLPAFRSDYLRFLDSLGAVTPRLVLVTPLPFGSAPPPLPDLTGRNPQLARYVAVIREVAAARGLPVVDLFALPEADPAGPWTTDGRQLSAQGQALAAGSIVLALTSSAPIDAPDPLVWFHGPEMTRLRAGVAAKNRIWFHYVRPTNWAFLAGDRVEQLSSRDHRDPKVRWFPGEVEQFLPLLQQAERDLDRPFTDAR